MAEIKRNDSCPCGSGKKYKKCCIGEYKFDDESKQSHWVKEEVEEFSTAKIIFKLIDLGVEFNKEEFLQDTRNYYSAQEISEKWFQKFVIRAKGFDEEFLWLSAWVLWRRLAPEDRICTEDIDDMMQ
jgi:hypothetical protein